MGLREWLIKLLQRGRHQMILVGDWYCWFCERKITEEVYVQDDPQSRRYGTPVYDTSWETIHTARPRPPEDDER